MNFESIAEKDLERYFQYSLSHFFGKKWYLDKHHPDMYEGKGKADFTGAIHGLAVAFELKVSNNQPGPGQLAYLEQQARAGATAALVIAHRKDGCVYLVPWYLLESGFSYRNRTQWFRMEVTQVREQWLIDLRHLVLQLQMQYGQCSILGGK